MSTEIIDYDINKEQKMLKSSYEMYENSIRETKEAMKNKINHETGDRMFSDSDIENQVNLLKTAQDDIVKKFVLNGGKAEDITDKKEVKKSSSLKMKPVATKKSVKIDKTEAEKAQKKKKPVTESLKKMPVEVTDKGEVKEGIKYIPKSVSYGETYDIIPLPSGGQCYPDKRDKVAVSYLTAYDENMIVSPNLYRDNLIIDYILENKIIDEDVDPSMLIDGDREAIILYLRASGYGNEYPIMAKDEKTGMEFETTVDLSEIKFKDFNLVGDENGFFDFQLPVSKKNIKFKFLNHSEISALDKLNEAEEKGRIKEKIRYYKEDMETYLELLSDETEVSEKVKIREALNTLDKWKDGLEENEYDRFSHYLTNKMELSIISIDGNTDREYISDFVANMPVRDSTSLRKYMLKNEPGLDYNFKVEKPESLGGGSMDVFLQFDQFVFLNIPE